MALLVLVSALSSVAAVAGTAPAMLVSADGFTTLSAEAGATAGTPYQSGQTIDVAITENDALQSSVLQAYGDQNITVYECAAVDGAAPTSLNGNSCDSNTVDDISINPDGSASFSFVR